MTTNLTYLPLILTGVLLNALAQLALKQGAMAISDIAFSMKNILSIAIQVIFNPWIFGGLTLYAISVVLWILTLSRVEVSYAYPMISIGYILVTFAGWAFFNESLSLTKLAGIVVIMLGVILISRP